jgi:nucleotide-binding universal stress UspA family protein
MEEVRVSTEEIAHRIDGVLQRARAMAEEQHLKLHTYVIRGHPVRDIVKLAADLGVDLLVIGAVGHSVLFERMIGSKVDRIVQLAHCPVPVAK